MQVLPEQILPSQDFLKERTVRFILECLSTGNLEELPPTSEANSTRNQELADKYDTVLNEQRRVATEGITSFGDLIAKYPGLLTE